MQLLCMHLPLCNQIFCNIKAGTDCPIVTADGQQLPAVAAAKLRNMFSSKIQLIKLSL